MKYIVRVVSEEAFKGLVTGYLGPFDTYSEASVEAYSIEKGSGYETECFIEDLHEPSC